MGFDIMIAMHYLLDKKEYSLYTVLGKNEISVFGEFARYYANVSITLAHSGTKEKFKITPLMHYDVVSKMKIAVDWFYDKKMNDLFIVDERNILVFNNDYNKLVVMIHSEANQHLEIRPVVNNAHSERGKEGVVIRINNMESSIVLDREEFERIYFYLANFSYQTEMYLLQNTLLMAKSNNSVPAINDSKIGNSQQRTNVFGL